ncbi:deoxyribonuclease V [Acidihalobacter prosperus]
MTPQPHNLIHQWNVTPAEARQIQKDLSAEVSLVDDIVRLQHVAGLDVGFEENGTKIRAAVVVLQWPSFERIEYRLVRRATRFPYVPGLLSFRELPALLEAMAQLSQPPDMIFCDGQGIAHPRRLGLAAHLGVITGLPSIGIGKSRLIGEHKPLPESRGSSTPLWDKGEQIGCVLRSRKGVKPLYVSPGHRVSMNTASALVMESIRRFRLPEPIRAAHRLASESAIARSRSHSGRS